MMASGPKNSGSVRPSGSRCPSKRNSDGILTNTGDAAASKSGCAIARNFATFAR